jgi:hypothetical protein
MNCDHARALIGAYADDQTDRLNVTDQAVCEPARRASPARRAEGPA